MGQPEELPAQGCEDEPPEPGRNGEQSFRGEKRSNAHVAQNITTTRGSRIDGRTTRHPGYTASLRIRERIEEGFGWMKEIAGLAQVKLRGLARVDCAFVLSLAAYNLVRLPKLLGASP